MKRKLVKQGNNALTVTLPKKWTRKYNLNAGDFIHLEESPSEITIKAKPIQEKKKISVNFDTYKDITSKYIHALYKQGVTEIELLYSSQKVMETVHKTISENLIGYEVVDQGKNKATIKSVAEIQDDNFDSMFRRIFHINQNMLNSLNSILKGGKVDIISSVLELEKTNNKLTNYCRRSISNRIYEGQEIVLLYNVIEVLERMADEIKYILIFLKQEKNLKVSSNEMKLVDEVKDFFSLVHSSFFSKDFEKIAKKTMEKKDIIPDALKNISKNDNFVLMHYLINIFQLSAHIITYKLQIVFLKK
ncbi:phosphate uptake regulator PhoU [archaeon]|jgi:phosphate uptake regulator|nr:phosphate uptake regulator PhoU [archaeon]MBT4022883.1 phosphate uptake regulator PhoU [archaeon]MBT4272530.1 phosphate uptake regulator PhoU [archaeon]MBT4460402.1 phosphate uptake regulator PhoU [archaeon]MBT4859033.1 phosphate uptake regulator PhoU [archaeon]